MSVLEAVLLGIVQGLTEFLPISSSGHLVMVPWLQDYEFLRENPDFNKSFDVAVHFGTLGAVVLYFRHEIASIGRSFLHTVHRRSIGEGDETLAWVILVGTIPAVLAGGLGEEWIDDNLGEPWTIAIFLIAFGAILWHADRRPQERDLMHLRISHGWFIGVAQAIALSPGTSRSGVTISAARYLGLDRDSAARISFLLLVPAVTGATALKTYEAVTEGLPAGVAWPMVAGVIAAGVSGYAAIAWLLRLVRRHSYEGFVIYRFLVAAGILILIATGAREATF